MTSSLIKVVLEGLEQHLVQAMSGPLLQLHLAFRKDQQQQQATAITHETMQMIAM